MTEQKQRPAFRILDLDQKDSYGRALEIASVWPAKSGKPDVYSVKLNGKYYTMVKALPPKDSSNMVGKSLTPKTEAPVLDGEEIPF